MRFLFIFFELLFITVIGWSQPGSNPNSFDEGYKKTNPTIHYEYDSVKQIHNYSNNWDLDNDSKPDQIYFVGTGGAHLYFYLRVILSSDNLRRDFPFIQSDFPLLPTGNDLKKNNFNPTAYQTHFAVLAYGNSTDKSIYIKLDNSSFNAEKKILNKKGINTTDVIITFKKGKTIFKDFIRKI